MAKVDETTTLLVIGGGLDGDVAAILAGQLGIPTVLVEGADVALWSWSPGLLGSL